MIIHETEECRRIDLSVEDDGRLWNVSDCEMIVIDKKQADELISALQLYANGEFKNDEIE
ncbi:hypothetical protein [Escherichia coli]|uniref:hypothetical protein n=1 Tax=Escherichia coli TaxID=562 RepID=UPI000390ED12|nr:hypothetical protein [Escherichia coli]EQP36480.1 hypothetical protein G735_01596 [Escherichia coli HVH 69 (4-2837072)]EQU83287.1 hypothetical protein G867_01661 [Escherichia coli HVH 215 (4-3008371)]EYE05498.1 hypothetical protein AC80_1748 [Escherichia coli 1-110-08_S4_C1]HBB9673667.1 hypothetical protein [Escherichia coli]